MPKQKYYITTAIPYVNAPPHIGHALEFIQTDVLARWHRLKGEDVFFLSGSDENAQKNVLAAQEKNISVKDLVAKNSELFKTLLKELNISNDDFIRTSVEKKHSDGATKIWNSCNSSGDIYKKSYSGLYCIGCEAFITEKELVDGNCAEHLRPPQEVSEENYFFKLSKYQEKLLELLSSDKLKVVPESRKNEMLSFIKAGLEDFSVSRPTERMKKWGVPVPEDKTQTMYVWFDALTNYITALGFAKDGKKFKKYWPADVHVIGKGITRFHTIYWPAILLSAGIDVPKTVFSHGYVTVNGQKISKSLGNVVDPSHVVQKYKVDRIRYFLLRQISPFEDGDFSESALIETTNADLADTLGNLLQRTCVMIEKYFGGEIPKPGRFGDKEKELVKAVSIFNEVDELMNKFEWHRALEKIMDAVRHCNKYVNETEPWKLAETDKVRLGTVLYTLAESLRIFSILLSPFIPASAEKIAQQLNVKLGGFKKLKFKKSTRAKIKTPEILFQKLESKPAEAEAEPKTEEKKNDFSMLNLKVAKILDVQDHPNADKLYVLKIDLGEQRQLVAGVKNYYTKEQLAGKNIVVLSNLKPAEVRGVQSQGMLLAAEKDGVVKVVETPNSNAGEIVFVEGVAPKNAEITIEDFKKVKLTTADKKVVCDGKELKTAKESVIVDIGDGATIR